MASVFESKVYKILKLMKRDGRFCS